MYPEGNDFEGFNGCLNFTNTTTVQEIVIAVHDNDRVEVFDKNFHLNIASNEEVVDTTTVTIKENDSKFHFLGIKLF